VKSTQANPAPGGAPPADRRAIAGEIGCGKLTRATIDRAGLAPGQHDDAVAMK
jgi:hypothetical protein